MKIRSVVALVGLAMSFALPTFAQQKDAVDPQIIQAADANNKKYVEATNNHDAAAFGALHTEDAVMVIDTGPIKSPVELTGTVIYGREAIEKYYADTFKGWQPKNHTSTIDPRSFRMLGPDCFADYGDWSESGKGKNGEDIPVKGYWSAITTRQGDAWKICVLTWNMTPDSWVLINKSFGLPPAATPSPTASPSTQ